MSDEEHHFQSSDDGETETYPQQAGTIRKNDYIVIQGRPCKVVEVSTTTDEDGHTKCHFVGIDIFTGKNLEDIVPSSSNCDVPRIRRTGYSLVDVTDDGFVCLISDNGDTKDLRPPSVDDALFQHIKSGFAEGKNLEVTVLSAMGEEHIIAIRDI